jgi:hypothetical protein
MLVDMTSVIDPTAIATVALAGVTFLSVVVAIVYGRHASNEAKASRQAQTFLQIYQPYYRSERAHRARRLIKEGLKHKLSPEDHEAVQEAYGYYDLLGIFVDAGLIDETLTRKMFSGSLEVAVANLGNWLTMHTPGNGPLYAAHLKQLVADWNAEPVSAAYPSRVLVRRSRGIRRFLKQLRGLLIRLSTGRPTIGNWVAVIVAIALAVVAGVRGDMLGFGLWLGAVVVQLGAVAYGLFRRPAP